MAEGSEVMPAGAPPFPGASSQDDDEVVAKVCPKPVLFCANPPHECHDHPDGGGAGEGARRACVVMENLWKKREILNVFFKNPDHLKKWKYNGKEITTDMILEWANVWNKENDEKIPSFEFTSSVRRSDIRVEFSDKGGCWSMVGMLASKAGAKDATMMLSLNDGFCHEDKRSLVIHEFGHALGLEHEHQRSDFWDGVEKHIDVDKMKDDERVKESIAKEGKASFGDGWFEKKGNVLSSICKALRISKEDKKKMSEYDPESIMHYGFDIHWLKDKDHHDMHKLHSISEDNLPEKKYLIGIHKRHHCLAKDPSKLDLETLKEVYHKVNS